MTSSDAPSETAEQTERPRRPKRWQAWAREMLVVIVIFAAVKAWQKRDLLPEGIPAPDVVMFDTEGRPHHLTDYAGKAVQLHVWATWCHVCTKEFGELAALHRGNGEGEALLAVAVHSGGPEVLRAYAEEHSLEYPVFVGGDAFVEALQVDRYPTNYYVSPEGVITDTTVGFSTRLAMRHRLRRAGR